MEKINVLQLVNSLDIGGLEKVVLEIVRFKKNEEAEFNYHLACLNQVGMLADQVPVHLPIITLNKTGHKYFSLIFRLAKYCKKNKITIIHCHNYAPLLFSVLVKILLLNKVKIVYTEHNQVYSISKMHLRIFKRLLKVVDHLVYVSNDLEKYFLKSIIGDFSKIVGSVVWNGIIKPVCNEEEIAKIKKRYAIDDEQFVIGTAVVMSKQKGLHNLIKASVAIIKKTPETVFLMVGDGPLRTGLEQLALSLKVERNFRFVGFQKNVAAFLQSMDLFILPSLWEGFSIVLLEATALGLPIVATDVGGNSEIVENEKTGLLIPENDETAIADAVQKIRQNLELRKMFSRNAKTKFERKFTVDRMVCTYQKIYKSLTI